MSGQVGYKLLEPGYIIEGISKFHPEKILEAYSNEERIEVFNSLYDKARRFQYQGQNKEALRLFNLFDLCETDSLVRKKLISRIILSKGFQKNILSTEFQYDLAIRKLHEIINLQLSSLPIDSITMKHIYFELGKLYYQTLRYEQSIFSYNRSIEYIGPNSNSKKDLGAIFNNIGLCCLNLRQFDRSESYFNKSREYKEDIPYQEISGTVMNLALHYLAKGKPNIARDYFTYALELCESDKPEYMIQRSAIFNSIGNMLLKESKIDSCIIYYRLALKLREEYPEAIPLIQTYSNLGRAYLEIGLLDSSYYFNSKALCENCKNNLDINDCEPVSEIDLINSLVDLAEIQLGWYDMTKDRDFIFSGLNNLEAALSHLISILIAQTDYYSSLANIEKFNEIFVVFGKAIVREDVLIDSVPLSLIISDLYRSLMQAIIPNGGGNPKTNDFIYKYWNYIEDVESILYNDYQSVNDRKISNDNIFLTELNQTTKKGLEGIQYNTISKTAARISSKLELCSRFVIISYFYFDDRLFINLMREGDYISVILDNQSDLLKNIEELRNSIVKLDFNAFCYYRKVIYDSLIAPIQGYLRKDDRIGFVLDIKFYDLPVDVLPSPFDNVGYLINDFVVNCFFDLSDRLSSVSERSKNSIQIFGPKMGNYNSNGQLHYAEQEVNKISDIFENCGYYISLNPEILSDDEGHSLENRKSEVIHIATHTEFQQDKALSSSISFGNLRDDEPTPLLIIPFLGLQADLVFINACSSGRNLSTRFIGILSFASFFAHNLSNNIVSTLWDIPDYQAYEFAVLFYYYYVKNFDCAIALACAKRDWINIKQPTIPIIWGGYSLYSNGI